MARKRAHNEDGTFVSDNPATPDANEAFVEVTPEPAVVETQSLATDPVKAAPALEKEAIETDVRKKLTTRPQEEGVFAPASPAVLEAAAKKVAEKEGFDLNRGTSIGARLMARSRKMV
jgi:hypothetical protein